MKFQDLLEAVGDLPVFLGSLLLAGDRDPTDVRRQLARWMKAGKVVQLRRNVYVLGAPWRRVEPHPFLLANTLHQPSYVSLESALAHHGLIPEAVPVTTSVTTHRPCTIETPLGRFSYRHVQRDAFFGYLRMPLARAQDAWVAAAAKALLDLVYLTPRGDDPEFIASLRLEGLEELAIDELESCVRRWGKPKIHRAMQALRHAVAAATAGGV